MDMIHGLHNLHFLRPAWLLALPVLWVLVVRLARRRARDGNWAGLVDPELLSDLRLAGNEGGSRTPWPWLALAWTLAVLALAGPSWQHAPSAAYRGNDAWVLVLDLSPSMAATDVPPNRATRARYALDDLLDAARDTRVALVVFSDESYTVTPLTDDVDTIRALLPPLKPDIMPSAGDNLAPALKRAGRLIERAGSKRGQVVVLTDGFADPAAAFEAAQKLRFKGIDVNVVGIGTPEGAPLKQSGGGFVHNANGKMDLARLNVGLLRQLAHSGGGHYVDLDHLPRMISTLRAHAERISGARAVSGVHLAPWLDGGIWLLPLLLPLAALLARRGWL